MYNDTSKQGHPTKGTEMSHYSVLVITKPNDTDIEKNVAELLAPYNENIDVAPYVNKTKEALMHELDTEYRARLHREIEYDGYALVCGPHNRHVRIKDDTHVDLLIDQALNGDRGKYELFAYDWAGGCGFDADGNLLTNQNPNSKWDWWQIGGRWSDDATNDTAKVIDLPEGFETFAVVTPDGVWHAEGDVGWFACVSNEDDDYDFHKIVADYEDYDCALVDCHI